MTHLGQQLSALIDGELEASELERVAVHMGKCVSCQNEVTALRTLKRRMNALGEAAAGAGLTVRLMGRLSELSPDDSGWADGMPPGQSPWSPPPAPPGGWPAHGRPSEATPGNRDSHSDQRAARFFLAGSVAIFLAGLGTAAVIAGGEPQAQAPAPPVTPSVDVLVAPHNAFVNQGTTGGLGTGVTLPWSRDRRSHVGDGITYRQGRP